MRRPRLFGLVLALLALSPMVSPAQAQNAPQAVSGRVITAEGTPIPAVQVTLTAADGRVLTAAAGPDGRFVFGAVAPGTYRLSARALGRSPAEQVVVLTAGETTPAEMAIVLPQIVQARVQVVGAPEALERIPGSAHAIGRRELERALAATDDIHRLLRRIPGLNLQEEDGYGLRPNIGMRGTGTDRSSKITLMEDGVLAAPAPYAAPAAYYVPTPGRMESLEVRKGSSQVKYGPLTTGGVLNYVSTSIPSDLRLQATMAGAGDATRRIRAVLGGASSNVGWMVETYQWRTDGFKRLDGGGPTGVDLADYLAKLRFNTSGSATRYQALEIKAGRTEQTGHETYLGLTDADFAQTPDRRYAGSQADRFDSTHEQFQVRHVIATSSFDVTTTVYRHDFTRAWYKLESVLGTGIAAVLRAPEAHAARMAVLTGGDSAPNALIVRNNNRTYYGAGVQSMLTAAIERGAVRHRFEAGVRVHQDEEDRFQQDDGYRMTGGRMILTNPGAPGSQTNQVVDARAVAVFLADTMDWRRWTLSPGVRYEHIVLGQTSYARTDPSRAGDATVAGTTVTAVIPGLGIGYAASPGVSIFGGVHRGFAPPGPGAAGGTRVESSVNYEAGLRIARPGVRAEAAAFFNDYENLLGRDTLSGGGSGDGALFNAGQARVAGVEAVATWNLVSGRAAAFELPVSVTYTFTHTEFRRAFQSQYGPWGTVVAGDEMPYVPRHQVRIGLDAERGAWLGRVEVVGVGRMRSAAGQGAIAADALVPSSVVLNLGGEYLLPNGARLFAGVQNVTNRVTVVSRHPAGVRPGLPRQVVVGLRLDVGR